MGKVYKKLVESFGYIAEAPINATGYDPDQVQYQYSGGKPNGQVPAGDPSPMKPGDTRYNPDYDPSTGKLKGEKDD